MFLFQPRHALEDHAERMFSSTCCRPGRVACSLSVLKRSYVPGETIRADVQIHNSSMRKSGVCRLQLKQVSVAGTHRALVYDILPSTHSEHWFMTSFLQHIPSTGLRLPSFNTFRAQAYNILPSTHSEHWLTTSFLQPLPY